MQVKRKKRVNMGIKRSEVAEPQWTKWDYAELIKHDLFSSELWKRTMDWNTILKHVKKMEIACLLIDKNCPSRMFSTYADLLEANLYILDDLFYFFTGIRIGSGEGLGIITAYSRLRFWNMVFYKEMKAIAVGLNRIEQHFLACQIVYVGIDTYFSKLSFLSDNNSTFVKKGTRIYKALATRFRRFARQPDSQIGKRPEFGIVGE